jgi:hypothetical protein
MVPVVGPPPAQRPQTTHEKHVEWIRQFENHLVVRNTDGTIFVLTRNQVPFGAMLVRYNPDAAETPILRGEFHVINTENTRVVEEIDRTIIRLPNEDIHKAWDHPIRQTVPGLDCPRGPITFLAGSVLVRHLLAQRPSYIKALIVQMKGVHSNQVCPFSYRTNFTNRSRLALILMDLEDVKDPIVRETSLDFLAVSECQVSLMGPAPIAFGWITLLSAPYEIEIIPIHLHHVFRLLDLDLDLDPAAVVLQLHLCLVRV